MNTKFSPLFLLVIFCSLLSEVTFAQGLGNSIGAIFGREEAAGPCPSKRYDIRMTDPAALNMAGDQLMLQRKYCEAIAFYSQAMIETTTPGPRTYAWFRIVESAFFQRDYKLLFHEAQEYLKEKPRSEYSERVHYLAVKAVHENIQLTKGLDSEWIQKALGFFDSEANETDGLRKPNFSFREFLELYPDSRYRHDIEEMSKSVRILMTEKVLKEARFMAMRYDYLPAINQLKMIVSQGPVSDQFAEALFELIRMTELFSFAVIREDRISNRKLAKWMLIEEVRVTPEMRQQLSEKLNSQAAKMKAEMKKNLPNNEWTKQLNR